MTEKKTRAQKIVMAVILIVAFILLAKILADWTIEQREQKRVESMREDAGKPAEEADGSEASDVKEFKGMKVVIDPGHGGDDPGKVGVNGQKEKDINLQIAGILRTLLENEGVEVIMTRTEDCGLSAGNAGNNKVEDLKKRLAILEDTKPILAVSIHQNSYRDPAVYGPQVFFYTTSVTGEKIATILQNSLNTYLDVKRPRVQKGNSTYYILKKTTVPTVIAECGFLSNPEEAAKLANEEYQNLVAQALFDGIADYLREWKAEQEVFLFIS